MPTILIAEDDQDDIILLKRAHARSGLACNLRFVKDGEEAIAYLSDENHPNPGLILLDIKMPGRNGHEVLAWIRRQPGFHFLPVIMLTASAYLHDIDRAYRGGANSYFTKTADPQRLIDMFQVLAKYWFEHNIPAPGLRNGSGLEK